jgi:SPP1 gp7 family putative phage head morphogenesis protein
VTVAVTRETLRLLGQIRIRVSATVDATTDDLIRSWAYGWQLVVRDWEAAVTELQQIGDGKWPTRSQVVRAKRAQAALEATFEGLQALTDQAGVTITTGLNDVIDAARGQVDVIASQLPKTDQVRMTTDLLRADPRQIEAILVRTQEQITKDLAPVAGDAYDTLREHLVRGVAFGQNPRTVARRMVRGIQVGHAEALTRAMVIARTEMLDAHRAATAAHEQANTDVLQDWQWAATLDSRTCPSCWAQHGTRHPLEEPGPIDHQQGRCARLSITKSWKDLGFDIDEPESLLPDAKTSFDALSRDDQLKVMGPARLQLLDDGDVAWSDLSTRRANPGWRDSQVVTPLRDLIPA